MSFFTRCLVRAVRDRARVPPRLKDLASVVLSAALCTWVYTVRFAPPSAVAPMSVSPLERRRVAVAFGAALRTARKQRGFS